MVGASEISWLAPSLLQLSTYRSVTAGKYTLCRPTAITCFYDNYYFVRVELFSS